MIRFKLDVSDVSYLSQNISLKEIETTFKALSNDKAPGPDGFLIDFYKANISRICKDLHDLYTEAISKGTLGLDINKGIIKLFLKMVTRPSLKIGGQLLFSMFLIRFLLKSWHSNWLISFLNLFVPLRLVLSRVDISLKILLPARKQWSGLNILTRIWLCYFLILRKLMIGLNGNSLL